MRSIPASLKAKIEEGDFTGDRKATTRVTIQKIQLGLHGVADEVYSSLVFPNGQSFARELPNVKSLNWDRSADQQVASMTMEMWNTKALPPGTGPDVGDSFDLLGYYTYNRGRTSFAQSAWGHQANSWQDYLVPDRVLRVYQGYGADYGVVPELDPNLVLTGVWLIDDITYSADGLITVECRDAGRLLIDQIMFPPVVPLPRYPLKFERYREVENEDSLVSSAEWVRPTLEGSSNGAAGSPTETQHGHHPSDAFDSSELSYWLSLGHDVPNHPSSFEWLQAKWNGDELGAVKFAVRGGPYRVYFSVWTEKAAGGKIDGWNGSALVPYTKATPPPNGVGTGTGIIERFAKIPYSKTLVVENGQEATINFPAVKGITKLRLTFTNLYNSRNPMPAGSTTSSAKGVYRVAVRDFQVAKNVVTTVDNGVRVEGNYDDYSEIVKKLLAYGGFFWPQDGKQYLTDGNTVTYSFAQRDEYLYAHTEAGMTGNALSTQGRIWGDIQMSGTNGPAALGVEIWDKKPIMDGINYVRDVLGFIFFVDEHGGAVFRSPNTFKLGNWRSDVNGFNGARTTDYVTIEDHKAILGLRAKLSSRNLRERVFVANVSGKFGAVAQGRIPYPSSLRRVSGWTDQHFETARECQVMADLITLRQLFTFRTNSLRIPANPEIQVDDQVKIFERTTGDAYFHYVRSIASSWDLESGKWTYDLVTSWLGEDPQGEWAFQTSGFSQETIDYLTALGQV